MSHAQVKRYGQAVLSREKLILSAGTVGNPPLPDLIAAARAGSYAELAIWPADYQTWRATGIADEEARSRFADAGLGVSQVDCLLMWMLGPDSKRAAAEEQEVFAAASALGAGIVSVIGPGDDRYSEEQLAERLAGVCRRGAERGFVIALEVAPWKGNIDLPASVRVADATGCRNVGLVIDSWHMFRGNATLADVRALPSRYLAAIQLSDAPRAAAADLVVETMGARKAPGAGELDLPGFVAAVDAALGDDREVAVTVEVLSDELRAAGAVEASQVCAETSRRLLARP